MWVDLKRIAYPYSKEFPTCGLYKGTKFLIGVPNGFVPEYTIAGADLERLDKAKDHKTLTHMLDKGFVPQGEQVEERIMWRGYKSILSFLVKKGYLEKGPTERLFDCSLPERQNEFPRNYIQFKT